jgi:hypothetical protein
MRKLRIESSASARWLGLAVVVGVFLGCAASFLPQQCLWTDETTQMTGIGLGPAGVVRWLAGGAPYDTGQVRDRMPPLSYWLGWAWSRIFGLNEASLRWFGVACVAMAAALVYEAARRAFGTASAWAAGLFFALSPAVIVLSVEIRAYPLFILWSAFAFYGLVRLQVMPGERWPIYAALAMVLPAAVATHFYGAVLAGSILAALAVLACVGSGRLRPVVMLGALSAVTLALLRPIIVASFALARNGVSEGVGLGRRLEGVKSMVVQLAKHPAISVHPTVSIVAVTAAVLLLALAIGVARSSRQPGIAVALTLVIGLLVVTAAQLVTTHFQAAASHYNVWMRPGFCILLSAGIASSARAVRRTAGLAFGVLLTAQASGAYQLAVHGDAFAHGAHRAIMEMIRARNLRDFALVLDDPTYRAMLIYHPIRYELGPGLEHFQRLDIAGVSSLVRAFPSGRGLHQITALNHRHLVVVSMKVIVPAKRPAPASDDGSSGDGPLARALRSSGDWRIVSERLVTPSITANAPYFTWKIDVFESSRPPWQDVPQLTRLPVEKPSGTESR